VVQRVWREKFGRPGKGQPPTHSNVDLAILDSRGRLVHWFDGFPQGNIGRRESLEHYTVGEIRAALSRLDLADLPPRTNPLKLPDLERSRGIRVFVRLMDDRMTAYQAPVVEVVSLDADDWQALAWPGEQRTVDASTLGQWLSQVYPPGVMERTDPVTKRAYGIESVSGELRLSPAGSDRDRRYALLRGKVRLTDEGNDGFSYEGSLAVVLSYPRDDPQVQSLHGVFEGVYPRTDAIRNRTRQIPLQAVFESLPD
jgi:hypothetical protein